MDTLYFRVSQKTFVMKRGPGRPKKSEATIKDIKRKSRRQFSSEEKIAIVIEGLRGE